MRRKTIRRLIVWAIGAWAELRATWVTTSLKGWLLNHAELGLKLGWFVLRRKLGLVQPYAGWRERLRTCSRCPVFHRELMTCGRPGQQWFNPDTQQMEQRGCLCPLRLKVQMPEAQCPSGLWPEEI